MIFTKNQFNLSIIQHIALESSNFEAEIISSPLDENLQIIPIEKVVKIDTPINPGHSDLIYLNPGLITVDEYPNAAIRRFSRRFFKMCEVFFANENSIEDLFN